MQGSQEIRERTAEVVSPVIYRYTDAVIESGQGSYLFDVEGKKYLDFTSGIGTCPVGHSHPEVIEAIHGQAQKILHVCDHVGYYRPYTDYMADVLSVMPGELNRGKGIFLNSGSEAVDAALKVARFVSRRHYVIAFIGSFHGRTLGAAAATGSTITYKKGLSGLLPGVFHVPYPYCYRCPFGHDDPAKCETACLKYIDLVLEKIIPPDEMAGIIIEPICGEGGYIVPPPHFLKGLKGICDLTGAYLIADEVQCGFGRTGKWLGAENFYVVPDIVALAKAVGGGMPLSAVIGKREIMEKWEPASHGTTFGGNPVSCAAAKATLQVMKREKVLENAQRVGDFIQEKFKKASDSMETIGDVRGKGLMIGVELIHPKNRERNDDLLMKVLPAAVERGLTLTKCGPNVIRIAPPLNITKDQAETGVNIILDAIQGLS